MRIEIGLRTTDRSRPARNTIDNFRIMTAPRVVAGGPFISFCLGKSAWRQAPGRWSRAVSILQAKKFEVEFLCLHISQSFLNFRYRAFSRRVSATRDNSRFVFLL